MIAWGQLTAAIGQSATGVLRTTTGWAVTPLFGPVRETRRTAVLTALVVMASVWLAAAVGILLFPVTAAAAGAVDGVAEAFGGAGLRLAMTGVVAVLPALAGLLTLTLAPPTERTPWRDGYRAAVLGYPLTVGMALALLLLAGSLPLLWLRDRWRGWSPRTIPVDAPDTGLLVRVVHDGLQAAGWRLTLGAPVALLGLPVALANLFGRGSPGGVLSEEVRSLRGDLLEIVFYPQGLVVRGNARQREQARRAIVETLAFGTARLTLTAAGRRSEKELSAWWTRQTLSAGVAEAERQMADLARLRDNARHAALPLSEWETLEYLYVQAERDLLRTAVHTAGFPVAGTPPAPTPVMVAPATASASRPAATIATPSADAPHTARNGGEKPATVPAPSPTGISPAAVAATLAAAAVVVWRMTSDWTQAEANSDA